MKHMRKDFSRIFWIVAVVMAIVAFFVANVQLNPQLSSVSSVFIIAISFPCYLAIVLWLGWKKGIAIIIIFSIYALVIETFAIFTGFPYSPFQYSELIGFKLFGYTPYTVPFAYVPLFLGCIYLANLRSTKKIFFIIITAFMVLITDLVLDPGAVALNFWQYQWTGIFYGVPFMNFLGWILTGIIASILAVITMGDDFNKPGPSALSSSLFLILSFWSAVCFYLGLYIPALIGVIFILYILYETRARVGDFGLDQAKKVTIHQYNE